MITDSLYNPGETASPLAGECMISYQDVSHAYDHATALDHVSLEIAAGETVALIGPSGCGKSTLLKLAVGLTDAWRRARARGRT